MNIETGKPHLRGYGGYTGPAIKPIIMRHFTEVARAVKIPLCGVGGIMSFREIVEYIMLGATTVQSCTAVMWNGYSAITKMIKDLNDWMDEKGYQSLDEIRGIALGDITTVEELATMAPKFASIDPVFLYKLRNLQPVLLLPRHRQRRKRICGKPRNVRRLRALRSDVSRERH